MTTRAERDEAMRDGKGFELAVSIDGHGHHVHLPEGTIIGEGFMAMTFVHYPYRKSPDVYICIKDSPTIHCCNGHDADIESSQEAFVKHIRSHDRRAWVKRYGEEAGR